MTLYGLQITISNTVNDSGQSLGLSAVEGITQAIGSTAGTGATGSLHADFMVLQAGRTVSVQGGSTLFSASTSEPLDIASLSGGAINIGNADLISNS